MDCCVSVHCFCFTLTEPANELLLTELLNFPLGQTFGELQVDLIQGSQVSLDLCNRPGPLENASGASTITFLTALGKHEHLVTLSERPARQLI